MSIVDYCPLTVDYYLPTANYCLPTTDYCLPTTDYCLPTADYCPLTTDYCHRITLSAPIRGIFAACCASTGRQSAKSMAALKIRLAADH